MKRFLTALLLMLIFILIFSTIQVNATIHHIQIGNNFFSPLGTTVVYGDTVRWTWDGGIPHSSTSDAGSPKTWESGTTSAAGFTFEIEIIADDGPGPFPYHCFVHPVRMKDTIWVDNDSDGFTADIDCDDNNPLINPGATDIPDDGIDQDCSGTDAVTCFVDNDQDGYGSFTTVISPDGSCSSPGLSDNSDDCNDGNALINPGATDIPNNGIDEDCDGQDAISCCINLRGNADGDVSDVTDVDDLVYMVNFAFKGGPGVACLEEGDVDASGAIDVDDLVFMVNFAFKGGPAPGPCIVK